MNNISLTNEELQNLNIFLGRVTLQGNEVPAFVSIMKKLNDPKREEVNNGE